jgi:hypothetical protein
MPDASPGPTEQALRARQAALSDTLLALRPAPPDLNSEECRQRARLARACLQRLAERAPDWVARSAACKRLPAGSTNVAEEWLSGPLVVARQLRVYAELFDRLAHGKLPTIRTGRAIADRTTVRATPSGPWDRLLMPGYTADVITEGDPRQTTSPLSRGGRAVVLGAGNISAMPLSDTFDAVFLRGSAVALKPSPAHRDLREVFADVSAPLADANRLAIVADDEATARALVSHDHVDAWHLTGARRTLESLLTVPAAADKPWTAEVGNVTPILVVPGRWPASDLRRTAEHVADLLQDNAAANCVTPRLVVTCSRWPQQSEFLRELTRAVHLLPPRFDHLAHRGSPTPESADTRRTDPLQPFAVVEAPDPWDPRAAWRTESLRPEIGFVGLPGDDCTNYLAAAVDFVHATCEGSLAAHVFAPASVLRSNKRDVDLTVLRLRHGIVGINTWAGIAFGLIHGPWGAGEGTHSNLDGRGFAHNALCLVAPRKTVVRGPARPWPLPPWRRHRKRVDLARGLCDLHCRRSLTSLLRLTCNALLP